MSGRPAPIAREETTFVGTLGWIGVVVIGALLALLLLSWLGPVGQ